MNNDTRIAVCCYAGDQEQVTAALELYLHHECPVVVLSPEDAKAEIPGVENRFAGKRAYTGQASLDRQREHMRILLDYPENFFLINDADSVCLSPKIPDYLYREDVLWSNLVVDNIKGREHGYYLNGFPRLAFQPPYFLSRKVLERLLASVPDGNIPANPALPFIDHYMVQLAVHAGVQWKGFSDGITAAISSDRGSFVAAWRAVQQRGAVMVHSVKSPAFWRPLVQAREMYLKGQRSPAPSMPPPMPWSRDQSATRAQQMRAEQQIALARAGMRAPVRILHPSYRTNIGQKA